MRHCIPIVCGRLTSCHWYVGVTDEWSKWTLVHELFSGQDQLTNLEKCWDLTNLDFFMCRCCELIPQCIRFIVIYYIFPFLIRNCILDAIRSIKQPWIRICLCFSFYLLTLTIYLLHLKYKLINHLSWRSEIAK